uniref:RRM domain-containing protein n=1 Tax=Mycena chlorophos TaxID=658473 RepID=A0ABQ0LPL6_MYCCL|nr:predicted protein [Mycena chlorophos]
MEICQPSPPCSRSPPSSPHPLPSTSSLLASSLRLRRRVPDSEPGTRTDFTTETKASRYIKACVEFGLIALGIFNSLASHFVQTHTHTLSTSVSSPAWFPSVDSPLIPSSSAATLVDDATLLSPPLEKAKSTFDSPALPVVVELEYSEVAEVVEVVSVAEREGDGEIATDVAPAPVVVDASSVPIVPEPSSLPPLPASPVSNPDSSVEIVVCAKSPRRLRDPSVEPTPTKSKSSVHGSPTAAPQPQQAPASPSFAPRIPEPAEKTPNVYINGLPPNFPEDQLFQLAVPFGTVRSVRSFTRHVGDTETGYGFVLFDTIAAAERCINALRRYRNLHPTFSKQVHKIPGTIYAHARTTPSGSSQTGSSSRDGNSSLNGWEQEEGSTSGDSTFKARMERLSDKSSTNLYIEGLPLSIDEATLAALVSPYSIRSSRFFQTRLSNPPRIIAFVRLETRSAAEEIIERLHGRMVRGWNDPGSRISVRFADTTEQRELRRQERLSRDGEGGSGHLSIAQATLLNLRGKELGKGGSGASSSRASVPLASSADLGGYRPIIGSGVHESPRDPSSSHYNHHEQPYAPAPSSAPYPRDFEPIDYSRGPRYSQQYYERDVPPHQAHSQTQTRGMNPAMASLLQSLQDQADYRAGHEHVANVRPFVPTSRGLGISGGPAHAQLGGYTPTEEFILRARSNSVPLAHTTTTSSSGKRRPTPLDLQGSNAQSRVGTQANIGMGVRGYRAQASTLSFRNGQPLSPVMDAQETSMNEEDFHSQHQPQPRMSSSAALHRSSYPSSSTRSTLSQQQQQNQYYQQPHSHSHSYQQQQVPRLNPSAHHARGASTAQFHKHNNNIYAPPSSSSSQWAQQQHQQEPVQTSPPLVSPALTYSSRSSGTGGYSPTTPFFGAFDGAEGGVGHGLAGVSTSGVPDVGVASLKGAIKRVPAPASTTGTTSGVVGR